MLMRRKKAQSTAEYAILISLVVGAALAMQLYLKRSIQAKVKTAANALTASGDAQDLTGDGTLLDTTVLQYEPYYNEQKIASMNRSSNSANTTTTHEGGGIDRSSTQNINVGQNTTEQTHTNVLQE